MTPRGLDADVVRQKLSLIEASLDTLQSLGEVTARRLAEDPVVAAAVERLLTRVVDLAVDVNSHALPLRPCWVGIPAGTPSLSAWHQERASSPPTSPSGWPDRRECATSSSTSTPSWTGTSLPLR